MSASWAEEDAPPLEVEEVERASSSCWWAEVRRDGLAVDADEWMLFERALTEGRGECGKVSAGCSLLEVVLQNDASDEARDAWLVMSSC